MGRYGPPVAAVEGVDAMGWQSLGWALAGFFFFFFFFFPTSPPSFSSSCHSRTHCLPSISTEPPLSSLSEEIIRHVPQLQLFSATTSNLWDHVSYCWSACHWAPSFTCIKQRAMSWSHHDHVFCWYLWCCSSITLHGLISCKRCRICAFFYDPCMV